MTSYSVQIYILKDPRTDEVKYVGRTIRSLSWRLNEHIKEARLGSQTHKSRWIRSLLTEQSLPVLVLIEVADSFAREQFWVAHYKNLGCPLTNLTDGGEGSVGYHHTEETRRKISQVHKGKPKPKEFVERIAAQKRGVPQTPEVIAARAAGMRGKPKGGRGVKGHRKSEETKKRMAAGMALVWQERKAKQCLNMQS